MANHQTRRTVMTAIRIVPNAVKLSIRAAPHSPVVKRQLFSFRSLVKKKIRNAYCRACKSFGAKRRHSCSSLALTVISPPSSPMLKRTFGCPYISPNASLTNLVLSLIDFTCRFAGVKNRAVMSFNTTSRDRPLKGLQKLFQETWAWL